MSKTKRAEVISLLQECRVPEESLKDLADRICEIFAKKPKKENSYLKLFDGVEVNPKITEIMQYETDKISKRRGVPANLALPQIAVEYYKTLRGFDDVAGWDTMNFNVQSKVAIALLNSIGLDLFLVLEWFSNNWKNDWNFFTVRKFYHLYYKQSSSPRQERQERAYAKASEKYT